MDRPRVGITHPSGPFGFSIYVVGGAPEPRHPTPPGAVSTIQPVPTQGGAATGVVAT